MNITWKEWVKDVEKISKCNARTLLHGRSKINPDALENERQDYYIPAIDLFESGESEISGPTFFEEESSSTYIYLCFLVLLVVYCRIYTTGVPIDEGNVWSLSVGDRRRLILSSLRDRYELAMEKLKCCMKEYNLFYEYCEVIIFFIQNYILQLSPVYLISFDFITIPVLPPISSST